MRQSTIQMMLGLGDESSWPWVALAGIAVILTAISLFARRCSLFGKR